MFHQGVTVTPWFHGEMVRVKHQKSEGVGQRLDPMVIMLGLTVSDRTVSDIIILSTAVDSGEVQAALPQSLHLSIL